jgi:hypothetical protein
METLLALRAGTSRARLSWIGILGRSRIELPSVRIATGDLVRPAERLALTARDAGGFRNRVDFRGTFVIIIGWFVGRRRNALRGIV